MRGPSPTFNKEEVGNDNESSGRGGGGGDDAASSTTVSSTATVEQGRSSCLFSPQIEPLISYLQWNTRNNILVFKHTRLFACSAQFDPRLNVEEFR